MSSPDPESRPPSPPISPYAPPLADLSPATLTPDAAALADSVMLRLCRKHAIAIQVVGICYLGFAGALFLMAALGLAIGITEFVEQSRLSWTITPLLISGCVVLALFGQVLISRGLLKFRRWARVLVIIETAPLASALVLLTLVRIPYGVISLTPLIPLALPAAVLYLLCSSEGTMIFSDEYQAVAARHRKPKRVRGAARYAGVSEGQV